MRKETTLSINTVQMIVSPALMVWVDLIDTGTNLGPEITELRMLEVIDFLHACDSKFHAKRIKVRLKLDSRSTRVGSTKSDFREHASMLKLTW